MDTVLNAVAGVVVLIVLVWVVIFGGVGALLSRSRGSSWAAGLAWGAFLGPFGWLAILWTTRTSSAEVDAAMWLRQSGLDEGIADGGSAEGWTEPDDDASWR